MEAHDYSLMHAGGVCNAGMPIDTAYNQYLWTGVQSLDAHHLQQSSGCCTSCFTCSLYNGMPLLRLLPL